MKNIKEEVLKELWGFDESAKDDESLSFDYDDVVDAIDLTQQKMKEDEIKFLATINLFEGSIHKIDQGVNQNIKRRLEELK